MNRCDARNDDADDAAVDRRRSSALGCRSFNGRK
jgi:hypothetical protein